MLPVRPQLSRQARLGRPCVVCRSLRRYSSISSLTAPSPVTSLSTDATLPNLRIGRHTRVIFQGFTGRQATANARESLAWGTNIVGGVTPGRSGEHLGLPVLPSVCAAVETLKPDATGIYVPAPLAPAAIEEAIAAEVPLVVAVAEHIPVHAMLRIHAMLKTQSKSRLVGANSPGIISAVGACRIGFQPLPCFSPGSGPGTRVGIAAKSGTLSYEAVASTTRAGLGQSLCIGVGGDIVAGTDLRESLTVLADDPETDAIALIGEIGGTSELEAAAWIEAYRKRAQAAGAVPKPIVALIGGTHAAVEGRIMGHAGAFVLPGEPTAQEKIQALERAGATVIDHPEKFGQAVKARLDALSPSGSGANSSSLFGQAGPTSQRRSMHTSTLSRNGNSKRPMIQRGLMLRRPSQTIAQKRSIYIGQDATFDLLRKEGVNAAPYSGQGTQRYLAITIDRSSKMPCVLAAPNYNDSVSSIRNLRRFPFGYRAGVDGLLAARVADHLGLDTTSSTSETESLRKLLRVLYAIFLEQEAYLVETAIVARLADVKVVHARLGLDDVAFNQRKATGDETTLRLASVTPPMEANEREAAAKKDGIVYVTLHDNDDSNNNDNDNSKQGRQGAAAPATIGTLVNGAGLAMNTVDALAGLGGQATNFLDTGGKATSETVKTCFQVLLQDPRVRVIFVNVFGGLTLGDMIARGVLLAFKETNVAVPVVVRIRGTNEAEGQEIIRTSGLPLFAYDSFDEAAAKAIELSKAA
ncbi:succinyl-CoA synthetase alpha subunit [Sporothrix schenckii 1099-18]|uniref:CoA-binding domain-containing protein n=2 Tax=Sporothrix schenckii TaxID=29908 RepID=U7PX49_SPOS1|nr:succinyl-CoA synthetase alpha subunit [Sporothrix schenckii 1099-18]ERT00234.1 hypothetical protein HMPREF1624_03605 [Sporothrix schenckii ATCC 58251]KJR85306.1 succinyl-CoA synthetase alpha subunit [Sporothrix schenckii 1099-18]